MPIAKLDRSLIRLSGEHVYDWLSGLVTNTLTEDVVFAALLTPQGKIIADFFVYKEGDDLILDTPGKFADILQKRLTLYRLRAPITIERDPRHVFAAWGGVGDEGFRDPRHPVLGQRLLAESMSCEASDEDYDLHRLSLGIPDSQWDFETGETFPANANMDLLSGVDFRKGCFVGQEVVSRMYRKTEIRKRMRGFTFEGELEGSAMTLDGRAVGEVMYSRGAKGMAMVRLDRLPDDLASLANPIKVGDIDITLLDLPREHSP